MPISPTRKGKLHRLPPWARSRYFEWKALSQVEDSWLRGAWRYAARRIRPRGVVLFYPELPRPGAMPLVLCEVLGYRLTNDPSIQADAAMLYEDVSLVQARLPEGLTVKGNIVNAACLDIRKSHVQEVFARTFGYSLGVDPRVHEGPMVEKSDENGTKDGRIVHGPLPADRVLTDCVYQRLVDNRIGGGRVRDVRIPIFGGRVPLVYYKERDEENRFESRAPYGRMVETSDELSAEELDRLAAFTRELGMDYAELDVLRDAGDGRIYVVDANKTPFGPPGAISRDEATRALRTLAQEFQTLLMEAPPTASEVSRLDRAGGPERGRQRGRSRSAGRSSQQA